MLQLNIFFGGYRKIVKCGEDDRENKRAIWFPLRPCCNMAEITHCQSMKGSFPRDCLISAYLHLLADRSQSGADACEHAGRLYTDH